MSNKAKAQTKPEVTPEVKPEVTPEVKPEVTPEVKPEVTSEVKPEVTSEVKPEVTPEVKPEVTTQKSKLDGKAFRRSIAAVVPGSRAFGSMPAAKMRLEEALQKVVSGQEAVASARAILEDLKGEKVTGADTTGADAILGDELPLFEDLIAEAEEALASLRGED